MTHGSRDHNPTLASRVAAVDWDGYLAAIAADSALVSEAARRGLEPDVPCCPGWTVRDLVGHLGQVHSHKERIVSERIQTDPPEDPEPPAHGLIDWYEEGAERLLSTLRSADPSEPVWTWSETDQTAGFWYRRMAHETLIHRVDSEQSHGMLSAVDEDLAADGIDEVLTVMIGGDLPSWASAVPKDLTIRIEAGASAWGLREARFVGTSPNTGTEYDLLMFVSAEVTAPDVTVRANADVVDRWLWGRASRDEVTVDGDEAVALLLREAAAEATQ